MPDRTSNELLTDAAKEPLIVDIPAVPADTPTGLKRVIEAIREYVQVIAGRRGNDLDTAVTFRDLLNSGIGAVDLTQKFRSGAVPITLSSNVEIDFSTPPAPTALVANGGFEVIYLSWNGAGFASYSYTEIWRASTNDLGQAVLAGTSVANTYGDEVPSNSTRYYWVRFVNKAAIKGPYNSLSGTSATSAVNTTYVLNTLSNAITESQLYSTLGARINLIDASDTTANSVAYRVKQEADARAAAILSEASARATGDSNLQTQINTLVAGSTGDLSSVLAAIQTEQTARVAGDNAEAASRETLATQLRGSYTGTDLNNLSTGLLYSERVARTDADSSLSSSISTLSTTVSNNYTTLNSAITSEATTRSTADSTIAQSVTSLTSTVAGKNSIYRQSSAPASPTTGDLWFDTNNGNITKRWNGSDWVQTDDTRIAANASAITSEQTARANADTALATSISTLSSTVTGNYNTLNSAITSEQTARANADTALATSISTLSSTVNGNTTAIQTEATARAAADGALQAQYTVKIDSNGYVSGYGLASTATNATPTSDFIVRADRFSIASPSGPGITPAVPFIVTTTNTAAPNGDVIPPGVYIQSATIKKGSIESAQIKDLTANKITSGYTSAAIGFNGAKVYGAELYSGGSVNVSYDGNSNITGFTPVNPTFKVSDGVVDIKADAFRVTNGGSTTVTPFLITGNTVYIDGARIGNYIQSSNYVAGTTGWKINTSDGSAEFQSGTFRGGIYASYGTIGGATHDQSAIYSNNYSAGSAGYRLQSDGKIYSQNLNVGAFNGYEWPAAGAGGGFHASTYGVLMGSASDGCWFQFDKNQKNFYFSGGGRYLNISPTGFDTNMYLNGCDGTFSGTLTANAINAVNTININGDAVTIPRVVGGSFGGISSGSWRYGPYITITNAEVNKPIIVWLRVGSATLPFSGRSNLGLTSRVNAFEPGQGDWEAYNGTTLIYDDADGQLPHSQTIYGDNGTPVGAIDYDGYRQQHLLMGLYYPSQTTVTFRAFAAADIGSCQLTIIQGKR